MQRSSRPLAPRSRATLRPRGSQRPTTYSSRGSAARIQKHPPPSRINNRTSKGKRDAYIIHDARDDLELQPPFPRSEATTTDLHRTDDIHACSEASLEFVSLSGLETDEDTNIIALNLMDYFLFSEQNWLPELSYCKLHAACFLFASRVTGKTNTVDQIGESLGPESPFVQLIGSPLAGDEESAAAIQYTISVTASDVEGGYTLLYERKEKLGYLLGHYRAELENLAAPHVNAADDAVMDKEESENWDVFDSEV